MSMNDLRTAIEGELQDLDIQAEVQLDSDFITTFHPSLWVGFKDMTDLNLYRLLGSYKERKDVLFEII